MGTVLIYLILFYVAQIECNEVSFFPPSFEISELNGSMTLMIFRDRGSYGLVSLFLYAQNLEAQQGLDFNVSSKVNNYIIQYYLLASHWLR